MTFKDYYQKLPDLKVEVRDKIIAECGIEITTFYLYLNGKTKRIPLLTRNAISRITGIPAEELFPQFETAEKV